MIRLPQSGPRVWPLLSLVMTLVMLAGCQTNEPAPSTSAPQADTSVPAEGSTKSAAVPADDSLSFGADWPAEAAQQPTVSVKQITADPDRYADQPVRVRGTVGQVCQRRGCWLTLTGDRTDRTVFVKLPYPLKKAFPQQAVGQAASVAGVLTVQQIPAKAARHFRRDAGADEAAVAQIKGPQQLIRIKEPAVRVAGIDQPRGGR